MGVGMLRLWWLLSQTSLLWMVSGCDQDQPLNEGHHSCAPYPPCLSTTDPSCIDHPSLDSPFPKTLKMLSHPCISCSWTPRNSALHSIIVLLSSLYVLLPFLQREHIMGMRRSISSLPPSPPHSEDNTPRALTCTFRLLVIPWYSCHSFILYYSMLRYIRQVSWVLTRPLKSCIIPLLGFKHIFSVLTSKSYK